MFPYCLKCKKFASKNQIVLKPKNGRRRILSNCAIPGSKKWKFI